MKICDGVYKRLLIEDKVLMNTIPKDTDVMLI